MSIDLINQHGGCWHANNYWWGAILESALKNGWEPAGTVLYRRVGLHPDMNVLTLESDEGDKTSVVVFSTPGDVALYFEQAVKSHELNLKWGGNYFSNDGQIITAPDAANLAAAIEHGLVAGDLDEYEFEKEYFQELIALLKAGECMIT